jgi:hypothetical protein
MSFKEQILQKKNLWHLGAVVLFLVVTIGYFTPAFTGHTINQGDVTNWSGAAQEILAHKDNGEVVHWTNSMFSGMPGIQIAAEYPAMGILDTLRNVFTLWLPGAASYLFLYFIGFYILAISLKVKPNVAMLGSIAYGLSSYFIIILQAGHNTKAMAIGYAPLVLAGFIWSYRSKKMILPLAVSGLFMAFELRANHLQIAYYLGMVLVAVGIFELVKAIKENSLPNFGKRTFGLMLVYGLAIGLNYGNVKGTLDYAKFTTRGGSELTINADGTPKEKTEAQEGLDTEYITAWSYGIGETFSLIVPNFKGGSTQGIGGNDYNKSIMKDVDRQYKQNIAGMNQYWGEQPFTSGPVYIGVIVVFLAFLAFFYLDDKIKWALLTVTIFTIMLSWGKNFLGFTEFFLDYLPGYNKFRAVTIILFVAELALPLLAVLFLSKLIKKREEIAKNMMPFFIVSGGFVLLFLLFLMAPTLFNTFITAAELAQLDSIKDPQQLTLYGDLFDELEAVRIAIFKKDVFRSLVFLILGGGSIFIAFKSSDFAKIALVPILGILILIDLLAVDMRYLGKETKGNRASWKKTWKQTYPIVSATGDKQILAFETVDLNLKAEIDNAVSTLQKDLKKNKIKGGEASRILEQKQFRTLNMNTHFRVFEQGNPFNSSRTSYFHKSIGGYHGAKLGIYQELIEFHLANNNMAVLNMLNMKYMLAPGGASATENTGALGNAWFVNSVKEVSSSDESIMSLNAESTDEFSINSMNGFTLLINGELTTRANIDGTEVLILLSPQNDSIPLAGTPFDAIKQQDLALITTEQGLQWAPIGMGNTLVEIKNKKIGFDPAAEAVMQTLYTSKLSSKDFSGEGSIELLSYNPDKLSYKSNSSSNQLAIFSEVFINEGWSATIDGTDAEILRANYVLRAIEVPAGEHEIVMVYNSKSFDSSNTLTMVFTILILLMIGGGFYLDVLKDSDSVAEVK